MKIKSRVDVVLFAGSRHLQTMFRDPRGCDGRSTNKGKESCYQSLFLVQVVVSKAINKHHLKSLRQQPNKDQKSCMLGPCIFYQAVKCASRELFPV